MYNSWSIIVQLAIPASNIDVNELLAAVAAAAAGNLGDFK